MGIDFTGQGEERKIVARCDHPGCRAESKISIVYYRYNRAIGKECRYEHRPRMPFFFWKKVFENPQRKNMKKLMLTGNANNWPKVAAWCEEHYPHRMRHLKPIPKHRQRALENSQRRYGD